MKAGGVIDIAGIKCAGDNNRCVGFSGKASFTTSYHGGIIAAVDGDDKVMRGAIGAGDGDGVGEYGIAARAVECVHSRIGIV